ncbi:MAG: hypothetical protein JOZ07_06675 [Solirubrobacterales bacterium]|nr:hypothetical protein [Solirubrobacterales bacterium]
MRNRDAKAHRITLAGGAAKPLAVAAEASAAEEVGGLATGTHRVLVDGVARARIVIGAVPGP